MCSSLLCASEYPPTPEIPNLGTILDFTIGISILSELLVTFVVLSRNEILGGLLLTLQKLIFLCRELLRFRSQFFEVLFVLLVSVRFGSGMVKKSTGLVHLDVIAVFVVSKIQFTFWKSGTCIGCACNCHKLRNSIRSQVKFTSLPSWSRERCARCGRFWSFPSSASPRKE